MIAKTIRTLTLFALAGLILSWIWPPLGQK